MNSRRRFCKAASLSTLGWFAAQALSLAERTGDSPAVGKAKSLILLWMNGGPSQLETFDPHPGGKFGGPTRAIDTTVKGVQFAHELPRSAEQMESIALIRSMVSKEGDHDRARYYMKTGYRPNPSVMHPSIGAIVTRELPVGVAEIPRYVSILSNDQFSRGGALGEAYDPLRIGDPKEKPRNVTRPVSKERFQDRLAGLDVLEQTLAKRNPRLAERTLHRDQVAQAIKMMDSDQLKAFHIDQEPQSLIDRYGDSPFGRGCVAARRLVEVGVRCVEVQLAGWDTHTENFTGHTTQNKQLDPAFASLIRDLRERDLLDSTLVVCAGEFGRTPKINPLDGRDHWPKGFSVALAGGGVRGGVVHGATDPAGEKDCTDPVNVEDLFATVLACLGINAAKEYITPIGRPIKFADGNPVASIMV